MNNKNKILLMTLLASSGIASASDAGNHPPRHRRSPSVGGDALAFIIFQAASPVPVTFGSGSPEIPVNQFLARRNAAMSTSPEPCALPYDSAVSLSAEDQKKLSMFLVAGNAHSPVDSPGFGSSSEISVSQAALRASVNLKNSSPADIRGGSQLPQTQTVSRHTFQTTAGRSPVPMGPPAVPVRPSRLAIYQAQQNAREAERAINGPGVLMTDIALVVENLVRTVERDAVPPVNSPRKIRLRSTHLDRNGGGAVFRRTSSLVVNPAVPADGAFAAFTGGGNGQTERFVAPNAFTDMMNKWATAGAQPSKRKPKKRSRQALGAASVASAAVALEDRTQAKKQPPAGQKEQGGGAAK